ncbi:MAG: hypothetical protein M5T52_17275 [Ignavibacteriaceae bacterium]|nr:hypothetical protein [Ignavibacteriaceae bacterium]
MTELYKTGYFDSMSVRIEENENTNQIIFQYSVNSLINEIEIVSNGIVDSAGASYLINTLCGNHIRGKLFIML